MSEPDRPGDHRRPLPPTVLDCPTCGKRVTAPVPSAAHQLLAQHRATAHGWSRFKEAP